MRRRQTEASYQSEAAYLKSVLLWLQEYWTGPAVRVYPLRAVPQGLQHYSARRTHAALNRRAAIIICPRSCHPEMFQNTASERLSIKEGSVADARNKSRQSMHGLFALNEVRS